MSFPKLQKAITGIHRGDLILLESRPGMGTTTFCINLAVHLARKNYEIGYLALDLTRENIALRIEKCLNIYKTEIIDDDSNGKKILMTWKFI